MVSKTSYLSQFSRLVENVFGVDVENPPYLKTALYASVFFGGVLTGVGPLHTLAGLGGLYGIDLLTRPKQAANLGEKVAQGETASSTIPSYLEPDPFTIRVQQARYLGLKEGGFVDNSCFISTVIWCFLNIPELVKGLNESKDENVGKLRDLLCAFQKRGGVVPGAEVNKIRPILKAMDGTFQSMGSSSGNSSEVIGILGNALFQGSMHTITAELRQTRTIKLMEGVEPEKQVTIYPPESQPFWGMLTLPQDQNQTIQEALDLYFSKEDESPTLQSVEKKVLSGPSEILVLDRGEPLGRFSGLDLSLTVQQSALATQESVKYRFSSAILFHPGHYTALLQGKDGEFYHFDDAHPEGNGEVSEEEAKELLKSSVVFLYTKEV